jgi:3-oxoacyl-[acyl-carrier-protein] synthase II
VSPIGVGREPMWQSVVERLSGVRELPHYVAAGWIAPFGGSVENFDPKELIQPRKSIKVMCREIQLASAAAEMAWQDASLPQATIDPERFGVSGAAPMMYSDLEEMKVPYIEWLKQEDFDIHRWSRKAMGELYPLWMLKYLPNMPACHIGIRYDARGPNNTICENDVASLLAISEAADVIERDHADLMIVVGTGTHLTINELCWHAGARLACCNGSCDPASISRPFDARRIGMVYGEGAAGLILESRQHAERRGAKIMARIAGKASRCEPSAIDKLPTGSAVRRAIHAALAAANIEAGDVGHVNAHGNSTREDDRIEAQAIRDALGDVPVTAPKSFFGNLGQGSGMVELCMSLVGMEQGVIPPTLNYQKPDPECPVNVVTEMRPAERRTFVALNHNTTGQAAAVIVECGAA